LIQWLLCRLKGLQKLHKGLVGYQAGDKGGCIDQRRC